jgi:hypothetical protein
MVPQEEIKRNAQTHPTFYIPIQPSWFIWHSLVVKQVVTLTGEKREAYLLPQLRDPCLPKSSLII